MPRYFVDVHDGQDVPDTNGTDLADLDAVRREAVLLTAQVLSDDPDRFWQQGQLSVEVRDETGLVLFTLYVDAVLSPALTPTTGPAAPKRA